MMMPRFSRVFIGMFCVLAVAVAPASAQLTLRMQVPDSTPDGYTVYVAGNWNSWHPSLASQALTETADGIWEIELSASLNGDLQFKFTLGSFSLFETNDLQENTPNRRVTVQANTPAEYTGTIEAWPHFSWPFANSTVTPTVDLLSGAFDMPQLGRTGRVMTYVPPNYETSGLRYPVVYALDGQLLFDSTLLQNVEEIRLDEQMDSLYAAGDPGAIIVAIEAPSDFRQRSDEYLPFNEPNVGGGQASETLAFITDTLKPYVDANYRTLSDREHTALFGISSGGVLGTYAAMMRPDVFGRFLIFSASFCLNEGMYQLIEQTPATESFLRMAFVSGPEEQFGVCELGSFSDGQLQAVSKLEGAGYDMSNILSEVVSPSAHAPWFWEGQFAEYYQWLMNGVSTDVESHDELPSAESRLTVYPNPGRDVLRLDYEGQESSDVLVYDSLGRLVIRSRAVPGHTSLSLESLKPGLYFVRVGTDVQKWIKQ